MIKTLLLNILLTFVWVALTGNFLFANYLFGFLLSFAIMWVSRLGDRESYKYFAVVPRFVGFIFFFLWELTKANLQVAYEVMTPRFNMKPGIVKVPLDVRSDFEITVLANLISLTPGTLSIDVSADRKVLYVHAMHITDKKRFIRSIKNGFEKRLLRLTR
ncbi:MAG TPA: Na+/H+ antiporter subunit E [Phnomibacter sp.]|nr:Na+/H+ antiporter subunit E [Phnomibacter sp.]